MLAHALALFVKGFVGQAKKGLSWRAPPRRVTAGPDKKTMGDTVEEWSKRNRLGYDCRQVPSPDDAEAGCGNGEW